MTETLATFPDPEITTIVPTTVFELPKTDIEVNNIKKKNID